MFTLAIACLTTSNLLWFMDLTFQVPMHYWSLQRRTLLPSPVTFTAGCCLCFGSVSSFFLELFLHWSAVAGLTGLQCWPGEFIFQCPICLPFHTVHGVLKARIQEYWSGLPVPSPVAHVLSEPSTMICPSWVAPHGMAHGFIETRLWSMW